GPGGSRWRRRMARSAWAGSRRSLSAWSSASRWRAPRLRSEGAPNGSLDRVGADRRGGAGLVLLARDLRAAGKPPAPARHGRARAALRAGGGAPGDRRARPRTGAPRRLGLLRGPAAPTPPPWGPGGRPPP